MRRKLAHNQAVWKTYFKNNNESKISLTSEQCVKKNFGLLSLS